MSQQETDVDPILLMDEIIDKLKLLDYENLYLKQKMSKPLSKTYFAIKSINTGDQFIYFSSLSFWLLNLCGSTIQADKKYDDPSTTSQNILLEMKNLGIDTNVPANKLRLGYGEYVCIVIHRLVNKAIEKKRIQFRKLKQDNNKDNNEEANVVDIEEEDVPDLINKEIDYGENNLIDNDNANNNNNNNNKGNNNNNNDDEYISSILKSDINKNQWKREVDKVSSKLKLDYENISYNNTSEWRSHIDKIKANDEAFKKSIPNSRSVLERLSEDIDKMLEKISKKESMISKNFSSKISEYKGRQKTTNDQHEEYNKLKEKVEKMEANNEEIKDKINDYNSKYDTLKTKINPTNVNDIKNMITSLSQEAQSFDMKISIMNHSLIKHKANTQAHLKANLDKFEDSLFDETN